MEEKVIIYVDTQGVIYMSQNEDNSLVQVEVDVLHEVVERPLYDAELRYIAGEFVTHYTLNENKVWGAIHEVRARIERNPSYDNQMELISLQWLLCESVEKARELKLQELALWDKSENVNTFLVAKDGHTFSHWVSVGERDKVMDRFRREIEDNVPISNFKLSGFPSLQDTPANLLAKVKQVASYADACYDVTEMHKDAIMASNTPYEYDFKIGYPEYITINLS